MQSLSDRANLDDLRRGYHPGFNHPVKTRKSPVTDIHIMRGKALSARLNIGERSALVRPS